MRFRIILSAVVAGLILTACSSSKQAVDSNSCSMSQYANHYYNTSQSTVCAEKYDDNSKLYGFGDMRGAESQTEMLTRAAQSKARMELGQKAAAFQNKIKGSITEVQNADGTTTSVLRMEVDIQLTEVSERDSSCEDASRGFTCYSLMEMPKSALLESTASALQDENEELYQKWMASEQYQSLLAEATSE